MNKRINGIRNIDRQAVLDAGYRVSEYGVIVSDKGRKPRVLKHGVLNTGHHVVNLRIAGVSTLLLVHRLVAMFHVANPDNKPLVNHLDGDKGNNRASNLEWCTHSENIKHHYDTHN